MENEERRMQNDRMQRANDLLERTKKFALAILKFCEGLPKDETSRVLGRQLLRSGTSVGANYRAAHRAKSTPDFISKLGTVVKEADESAYWIELLTDAKKMGASGAAPLHREATELVAITVASINTARRNASE